MYKCCDRAAEGEEAEGGGLDFGGSPGRVVSLSFARACLGRRQGAEDRQTAGAPKDIVTSDLNVGK